VPSAICVFSSSSDAVAAPFFAVAGELGAALARRCDTLIYGGAKVGLMGALARAAHDAGGRVVGVIPASIHQRGLSYDGADELLVTPDMHARKRAMAERADAFIALPGGWGTLEEMFEVMTLKQLGEHAKPVIWLNIAGFYDPLLRFLGQLYDARFARPESARLYHVASDVASALAYLDTYQPPVIPSKWM